MKWLNLRCLVGTETLNKKEISWSWRWNNYCDDYVWVQSVWMQSAARWGKKWFSWLEPVLEDSGGGNLPPGSLGGCLGYRVAVVTDGALPGWASSKHGGIFSLGLQIIIFASLLFALITCLLVLCAELQVRLLNCLISAVSLSLYIYIWPLEEDWSALETGPNFCLLWSGGKNGWALILQFRSDSTEMPLGRRESCLWVTKHCTK